MAGKASSKKNHLEADDLETPSLKFRFSNSSLE